MAGPGDLEGLLEATGWDLGWRGGGLEASGVVEEAKIISLSDGNNGNYGNYWGKQVTSFCENA